MLHALLSALALLAAPSGDPFERFTLENGVRVAVLHVEDAPLQSTFTLLPLGLLHDGPGRPQWSHLVEHMLIHGSDDDALVGEGVTVNGETTALALRMETLADPERWREAQDRHARWIGVREVDGPVLARERTRIASEIETTTANRATGKWAQAAWCQVVLHGRAHVAVRGSVDAAEPEEVEAYIAERVRVGPDVQIVAIGPVEPKEVVAALAEAFDGVERSEAAAPPVPAPAKGPFAFGDGTATWDLDNHHYLEWYPLPDESPADRAIGLVLAQRLHQILFLRGRGGEGPLAGGLATATHSLVTPLGRGMLISVPIGADTDLDELRGAIRGAVEGAVEGGGLPPIALSLGQMAAQATAEIDFAMHRRRMAGSPAADRIEAQLGLSLAYQEARIGLTLPELAEAVRGLDAERVKEVAAEVLSREKRSSLVLRPKSE